MEKITTGALLDYRNDDEKNQDFAHEEVAMGFEPYVWTEGNYKPKYYYPHDQSSSLSCVAGYAGIVLEKHDGLVISRKDIYNARANYPLGGMAMPDVMKLIRRGACLEETLLSQKQGEKVMNERYVVTPQILQERDKNKGGVSFNINGFRNIDTIASIVKEVPVCVFWFFDEDGQEWWREYPTVKYNLQNELAFGVARHQVAIVDAVMIGGKKYLVGQDTAGVGTGLGESNNLRLISEDVLAKRAYAAGYILDNDDEILKPEPIALQPKFAQSKAMKVGSKGDGVKQLQAVLIYEGLLNIKEPSGYYGGATRASVIKLQEKYAIEILTPVGLKFGTGIVGNSTLKFLNNKYK